MGYIESEINSERHPEVYEFGSKVK
jgi:hypothetical protein